MYDWGKGLKCSGLDIQRNLCSIPKVMHAGVSRLKKLELATDIGHLEKSRSRH